MADSRISELSTGTTPLTGTEQIVSVQSGTTFKFTTQDVADLATSSNIGNSDLTISATGTRKLILGGALSTDTFTIRNSADSADLFEVQGNGDILIDNGIVTYDTSVNTLLMFNAALKVGLTTFYSNLEFADSAGVRVIKSAQAPYIGGGLGMRLYYSRFAIGNSTPEGYTGTYSNTLSFKNGTAPTGSVVDQFIQYSADESAGNACPHFLTEGGDLIKLYKEAALTASDGTTLANVITRMDELEARLQNIGILT